jgi:hypothetical protein
MLPVAMKLRLHEAIVPVGDDCWLVRCHGLAVYDEDGRVGFVRNVRFGESPGVPSALVVCTGLFIRTTVIIPVAEIDEISEKQRRIVLRPQPRSRSALAGRSYRAPQVRLRGT